MMTLKKSIRNILPSVIDEIIYYKVIYRASKTRLELLKQQDQLQHKISSTISK